MSSAPSTLRIAHLSDVHMLETRPDVGDGYTWRTRLVSYARALDARERAERLRRSLASARAGGASHFVISGDLTEIGSAAQYEVFAGILHDSAITPERVTLVPGNHDAYTAPDGWRRAMEGPLRAFEASSAGAAGKVVDLGEVAFLPVDLTCFQSIARAGGEVTEATASAIEARLIDPALARKPVVLVQHHPPFMPHKLWGWVDGLRGSARLVEIMKRHANVHLLHGHLHRIADYLLGRSRVFGAPAVVDDRTAPRVRFYELRGGVLEAV